MNLNNLCIWIFFICFAVSQQSSNDLDHFTKHLKNFEIADVIFDDTLGIDVTKIPTDQELRLTISGFQRTFLLIIKRNIKIFNNTLVNDLKQSYWTGFVFGKENSMVSLTLEGSEIYGQISIPGDDFIFHIDTLDDPTIDGGKRVIIYRSIDVKETFIGNNGMCTVGSDSGASLMSFGKREVPQSANKNQGKACVVALLMDYSFFQSWGNRTESVGLSIMNDVGAIYKQQFNVSLPVGYIYIDKSGTGPMASTSVTTINQYLELLAAKSNTNSFPNNFDKNQYCIVHLLTAKSFEGRVGLAYLSQACQGVSQGSNVGLSTMSILDFPVLRSNLITTVAHEIGHNFGSSHDTMHGSPPGNDQTCDPVGNKFIMYPNLQAPGPNSLKFSPCSEFLINRHCDSVTCLKNPGSYSQLESNYTEDIWMPYPEDQCAAALEDGTLKKISPDSWTDCLNLAAVNKKENICNLLCVRKSNINGACTAFANQLGTGMIPRRDGTPCDSKDSSKVCISGSCVTDTRKNLCASNMPCCDSFGNIRKNGVTCRRPSPELLAASQGCRLDVDKCDGSSETWCPPYFKVPGTACACKGTDCAGFCGQEKTLGMCVSSKTPGLVLGNLSMPASDTCQGVTCAANLKCIMVTGQPICVSMKSNSCKYRCGGVSNEIYSCSCNTNCIDDDSCCSDYKAFCRPLQGFFTLEGMIQRLWLLWDQEKMKILYAGGGFILFLVLLLIRCCLRRKKEED